MADEPQQLHVAFFPFMADGHMIPTLDMVKVFAARGVKTTIITTPLNVPIFTKAIEQSKQLGAPIINIEVFRFPATENGLPDECESLNQAIKFKGILYFMKALETLKEQLEQYLEKVRPDCLVADMFLTWTTETAAKFNIPRVVFHGTGYFALCAEEQLRLHKPYQKASYDEEPFIIPYIPHDIKMTRLKMAASLWKEEQSESRKIVKTMKESELQSYGVIVNSFYELEPDYADFFSKTLGRKAWHIGPVSLCNRSIEDKAQRGKEACRSENDCMKWLNLQQQDSVLYICTGSLAYFNESQIHEIAMALEALQQKFLWVMKDDKDGKSTREWLPPGFEQRMEGKGLILSEWAPQLLILEHEAIGAFVTHCGWNSTLESISAGVPMVTWPGTAEQFYNEKLVTEILNIGVPVGAKKWSSMPYIDDLVKQDAIGKALQEIMKGEEAQDRRNRVKKLKEMAQMAVEENGSSFSDLGALIDDLKALAC